MSGDRLSFVDSHCHLDFPDFADEIDDVIARAKAAGIGRMLTIATRLDTFPRVLALAEKHRGIACSVGIHPHEAEAAGAIDPDRLVALTRHPKVVAIGETGLDYFYDKSPRDRQGAVFAAHIAAASASGLPIIVHSREAEADTIELLRAGARAGDLTGVIHCFTATRRLAEAALDLGFYISFSGIVTFKNAQDLRDIAAEIPLDRLLVETDAPYLAPVPMRGKRNEPAYLIHTARAIAELRGLDPADLAAATSANFDRLFAKMGAA